MRKFIYIIAIFLPIYLSASYSVIERRDNNIIAQIKGESVVNVISTKTPKITSFHSSQIEFVKKYKYRELTIYAYRIIPKNDIDTISILLPAKLDRIVNRKIFVSKWVINPEDAVFYASVPSATVYKTSKNITHYNAVFSIKDQGIYRISYNDFVENGLDVNFDPRKLKVFSRGIQIPIYFFGEEDGIFNEGDYIEFIAERQKGEYTYYDPCTDSAFYYVSWEGNDIGFRMFDMKFTESEENIVVPMNYDTSYHIEGDSIYRLTTTSTDTLDYWVWETITSPDTGEIVFNLSNIDTTQLAYITVLLQGMNDNRYVFMDHSAKIWINGYLLSECTWSGYRPDTVKVSIPPGILKGDDDTLKIYAQTVENNGEYLVNVVGINYIEIQGKALYYTDNNYIEIKAPYEGSPQTCDFQVKGFTDPLIKVYRIGQYKVDDVNIKKENDGTYSVDFKDKIYQSNTWYVISAVSQIKTPAIRSAVYTGFDEEEGYDFIIIAPQQFVPYLNSYKRFKDSLGISTYIISEEEIRDHFDYGRPSAEGIKEFFKYVYENWSNPPRYAMLVGTGSADGANRTPYAGKSVMPLKIMLSTMNRSEFIGSDTWLGSLYPEDDRLPEIMVGRIPAQNIDDVKNIINKFTSYYTDEIKGLWKMTVALLVDSFAVGGDESTLENTVLPILDDNFIIHNLYTGDQDWLMDIVNEFKSGNLLTIFVGHGNPEAININYLDDYTVARFGNYGKLPFMFSISCNNVATEWPYKISIAEAFVKIPQVGTVGFWGATSKSRTVTGNTLLKGALEYFMDLKHPIIGDMIYYAYALYFNGDPYEYNFIGDPSMFIAKPYPIDIELDKKCVLSGDSISAYVNSDNVGYFYLYDEDNTIMDMFYGQSINDTTIKATFKIPDDYTYTSAKICFFSDNMDGTEGGKETFSVNSPYIDTVYNIPSIPDTLDSVYVYVKPLSPNGIDRVILVYGKDRNSLFSWMYMEQDTGGIYKSEEPILFFDFSDSLSPGDSVFYYIQIKDTLDETYNSALSAYEILPYADIYAESLFVSVEDTNILITAIVANNTLRNAENVVCNLYMYSTDNHFVYSVDTIDLLNGDTKDTLFFPINIEERTKCQLLISYDPDNEIIERNENNNVFVVRDSVVMNYYLFPVDSYAFSLDSTLEVTRLSEDTMLIFIYADTARTPINQSLLVWPQDTDVYTIETFSNKTDNKFVLNTAFYDTTFSVAFWDTLSQKWIFIDDSMIGTYPLPEGTYTLLSSYDNVAPYIRFQPNPEYLSNNNIYLYSKFSANGILEDANGIDFAILPPVITIDGDTVNVQFDYSPQYANRINFHLEKELSNGKHTIKIICRDVYGNSTSYVYNMEVNVLMRITDIANHPNPVYKNNTIFRFYLTDDVDRVLLEIFSSSGKLVYKEEKEYLPSGFNEWYWDLRDKTKYECSNGIYFYRFTAVKGSDVFKTDIKTMVIAK